MRLCSRLAIRVTFAALAVGLCMRSVVSADAADAVPGVTDTQILLGGTHPFSGPASAYGVVDQGIQAYFHYVNAHGGVNGRSITYKDLDDAYSPPQALQLTKQLVEQDHVFAIFNTLGTAVNVALRPYLNEKQVPQLFLSTGATTWGTQGAQYPWTIGFSPDYQAEAIIFGKYIAAHQTGAKVAILYQNDDLGQDYVTGMQRSLPASAIVKTQSYEVTDPDVRSQIAALKGSGADTILLAATPKFATQALVTIAQEGWKPMIYLSTVSASNRIMKAVIGAGGATAVDGVTTAQYLLDPANPAFAATGGIEQFKSIIAMYEPGADSNDIFVLYGMAAAYTMVDALKAAGRDLTREKVMNAALHLDEHKNPFLLPGIVLKTSPSDRFPIRQEELARYTADGWKPIAGIIDARK